EVGVGHLFDQLPSDLSVELELDQLVIGGSHRPRDLRRGRGEVNGPSRLGLPDVELNPRLPRAEGVLSSPYVASFRVVRSGSVADASRKASGARGVTRIAAQFEQGQSAGCGSQFVVVMHSVYHLVSEGSRHALTCLRQGRDSGVIASA